MKVEVIQTGALMENCYAVFYKKAALLIDPGADAEMIKQTIDDICSVKMILLTHGHFDHIGAVRELADFYKVAVYAFSDEIPLIEDVSSNLSSQFGNGGYTVKVDYKLTDGENIPFEDKFIRVIHTPGHTTGSCCFLLDNFLFTGDTLFYMSVGRTDFPTGSFDSLVFSLHEKLMPLPADCIVYPGHGNESTLGFEIMHNPYFKL